MPTTWPDVGARAINGVVLLGALWIVYALASNALAGGHTIGEIVTFIGGIASLIVSLVGLFFGIVVGKQGLDSAKQAQDSSKALQTRVASGLADLKSQLPQEHRSLVDNVFHTTLGA